MWTANEINSLFNQNLPSGWQATGVSIDTRSLRPGEIYAALKGLKFDGHDYVDRAVQAGASAALVEKKLSGLPETFPQILVQDVLKGLSVLAQQARQRFSGRVAAITGSVGKTSSKEALNLLLNDQAATYVTPRSFNNHWGLPLTMANLPQDASYAVIELGMNQPGEIAGYVEVVKPQVAYITNIEGMHVGKLGSIEAIARAKAEIFRGLQSGGIAIINTSSKASDIIMSLAKSSSAKEIWTIGTDPSAQFRLIDVQEHSDHQIVTAEMQGERLSYRLNIVGSHWVMNSIGILAVVKALGADLHQASKKFSDFQPIAGRGQQHRIQFRNGQIRIIDESYNAGPASMRAALEVLGKAMPEGKGRRIAVLGDMLELGDSEKEEHINLKDVISDYQIDLVYTSGERMGYLAEALPVSKRGLHCDDPALLAQKITAEIQPGDVIMVKGSRGGYQAQGRMYAVVASLLALRQEK